MTHDLNFTLNICPQNSTNWFYCLLIVDSSAFFRWATIVFLAASTIWRNVHISYPKKNLKESIRLNERIRFEAKYNTVTLCSQFRVSSWLRFFSRSCKCKPPSEWSVCDHNSNAYSTNATTTILDSCLNIYLPARFQYLRIWLNIHTPDMYICI